MRASVRRELFSHCQSLFAAYWPRFEQISTASKDTAIWKYEAAPDLTLFVLVTASDNRDAFSVELAWSDNGAFPWNDWCFKFQNLTQTRGRERLSLAIDSSEITVKIVSDQPRISV